MTAKKLFELLKRVETVTSNRWNDVLKIVKIMPSIEVKEKEWNDKYKQDNPDYYPLDLSKIETWSLRDTIALFILPRLKRYQEIANDFLERDEKLVNDIECFIKSMELVSRDNGNFIHTPEEKKQMEEGLEKFHKIFLSLWW